MGLEDFARGLTPGLVLGVCWGQGQGFVARGQGGAKLKRSPAICSEALPGPLEGEGGSPSRRGKKAEEGEGRGQWSRSGCQPPAGCPAPAPASPTALTPQSQQSHALSCSGPWASGPSLPSALHSETSAAGPEVCHHHPQGFPGRRQKRRPSSEQPPSPPHTSPGNSSFLCTLAGPSRGDH